MIKNKGFGSFFAIILCWMACSWTVSYAACPEADLSGDCIVDMTDLLLLADNWLAPDVPKHPNMTARWLLDESTGETATDLAGGYEGVLHGDPQWMPFEGYDRGALFFDGVDDYVEVPGYQGVTGTAGRTCSAWIQTSMAQQGNILTWGNEAVGEKWMFRIEPEGMLGVGVWGGFINTEKAINDDQWHHVAAVMADDGSPDISEIRLYIDGVLQSSSASNPLPVNTVAGQNVMIGAFSNAGAVGTHFLGKIDDIHIYDTALTSQEILRLYRTGSVLLHNPDINSDYQINFKDYAYLSGQWNMQAPDILINEFLASNDAENPPIAEAGQIRDGNGDSSDWIELYNQTDFPVELSGWGLTDDDDDPYQWVFPEGTILNGRSYLVVFASGRDNDDYPYVDPAGYLHTNFKLSASGEYLALTRADGTLQHAYTTVEDGFPEQEENISYGLLGDDEYYFALPTPGEENRQQFLGFVEEVDFSHERGNYTSSFALDLSCSTDDAVIRYTTNGTVPTLSNGFTYTSPINVTVPSSGSSYLVIRAAAFKPGYENSRTKTKTYLLKATAHMLGLPTLFLSGSPTQTFFYPNGIMAVTSDYNNMLGHGMEYERPVSMEFIHPELDLNFQEDCGIRVHGSAYMRPRYQIPPVIGPWAGDAKISFRLYFRSDYGESRMRHGVLDQFPHVDKMDTLVLRAGHNDRTNPFIRDEMIRRLQYYTGNEASLGTFVNLFINGDFKGYYNLCERVDEDFCQKYYNSNLEWDVVGWVNTGGPQYLEARDGDMIAFKELINYANSNDLSDPVHYTHVVDQLDLEGFVDYLIVQCWGGNWDWPQNNWTAASERSPNRKWRFYVWDAEGCMDNTWGNNLTLNRVSELYYQSGDLPQLYKALWRNDDFRMLFCDRLQKHFLEPDGVMRQAFLDSLFWQLADEVKGVIPNIISYISQTYIPNRQAIFFDQCESWALFTYEGPRFYLDGQEINISGDGLENSTLAFDNPSGSWGQIYYTLDGTDPRRSAAMQTESVTLVAEDAPKRVLIPTSDIGTNWRTKPNYNDINWNDGLPVNSAASGGVGYEVDSGNEPYISYDVRDEMYGQRTSAYIRIPFTVDPQALYDWNAMVLGMRYDDAFVAYINGVEVCRAGFSGTPYWYSNATSSHENNDMEAFSLNEYLSVLQPGENVLAIHGLNVGNDSSDFLVSPILIAGYDGGSGISPRAQRYTGPVALQKSAKVKARIYDGGWSALREVDIVISPVASDLRMTEIMYHPNGDPNEEYIELTNVGDAAINLNYVTFTDGIEYTFGDTVLAPNDYLLLVRDQQIFENRYGTGLPVIGEFEGALDNAGETLTLADVTGRIIQTVDYKDGWYSLTDGDGFSLTAADPLYGQVAPPQSGLTAHWRFDEAGGTIAQDSEGGYHGTIVNMVNTDRALGYRGKALRFDDVDDYVEAFGYQGITGSGSRTCSAWINTTAEQGGVIVSWGTEAPGQKWMFRLDAGGTLGVGVWDGYLSTVSVVNDGQWHHVAAVLNDDGSPDVSKIKLYIDGVLQPTTATNTQTINTVANQNVIVGAFINAGEAANFFAGRIDDVRIYDRALSPDEIRQMTDLMPWDRKELWLPSAVRGGTPGRAETPSEQLPLPGAVVINEVLAHSHAGLPDWIELYNTTGTDIDISGWYLSDADATDADRKKFRIPDGTVLTAASPYYLVEETVFNNISAPGCIVPFALSEGGETLYLQAGLNNELAGYLTQEEFDATETNVSLGRFQKSTGTWNFVPMAGQTPGAANTYPKVGPIIISEIMYNPETPDPDDNDQDYEYIELMNISSQTVRTASFVSTYTSPTVHYEEWIPWAFTDGITFEFPADLQLAPGQRILLVKNLDAFEEEYTVPGGTVVLEWTDGALDNGGEKLQLSMPGDREFEQDRYYIRADRVNYDDEGDWTPDADGTGQSLTHSRPTQAGSNYTNDPVNWTAAAPTPGSGQ